MIRTQIYLTEVEQKALKSLSKQHGKSKAELIRAAIDEFIARSRKSHKSTVLKKAQGIWEDNPGTPDIRRLRDEFDR